MIDFGDIFRFKEDLYVYLIQKGDSIFAARICNTQDTRQLVNWRERDSKNPRRKPTENPMFCFTLLSTEDFKDQSAHYGNPEVSGPTLESIARLNDEDIEALKKDIREDTAGNIKLREAMNELFPKQD